MALLLEGLLTALFVIAGFYLLYYMVKKELL